MHACMYVCSRNGPLRTHLDQLQDRYASEPQAHESSSRYLLPPVAAGPLGWYQSRTLFDFETPPPNRPHHPLASCSKLENRAKQRKRWRGNWKGLNLAHHHLSDLLILFLELVLVFELEQLLLQLLQYFEQHLPVPHNVCPFLLLLLLANAGPLAAAPAISSMYLYPSKCMKEGSSQQQKAVEWGIEVPTAKTPLPTHW